MVSMAVLRRTKAEDHVNYLHQSARRGLGRASAPCPICRLPMREVSAAPPARGLMLDVCTRCQFIWFDPTELQRTPDPSPRPLRLPALEPSDAPPAEPIEPQPQTSRVGPDHWYQWLLALFGLPVEHGAPALRGKPWITWVISATILILSIIGFVRFRTAVEQYGLIPAQWSRLGGLTVLTSFFLHANWVHLLGNLYFLLIFGDNTEDVLGPLRYGLLLLLATAAGGALYVAANLASQVPCIGASGGISGVLVFYLLRFPHARMGVLLFRFFFYVKMPAPLFLLLWIGLQALGSFLSGGGAGVAYLAHLGGAAVGVAFWLADLVARRIPRRVEPA
jgi:membrane associated rhomboid family serine protease